MPKEVKSSQLESTESIKPLAKLHAVHDKKIKTFIAPLFSEQIFSGLDLNQETEWAQE